MLHVIYDPHDPSTWYPNYLEGLRQALDRESIPYEFSQHLPKKAEGPVFLTRYTVNDLLRQTDRPPEHVIIQEHDVWNPFTNAYDPATLWIYNHPSLKTILVTNPSMVRWAERCLPAGSTVQVVVAGFPYDHGPIEAVRQSLQPASERERLVVFPGRLNEFYQPYLSVRLAHEFMDRGYKVVIASPIDPLSYYPVSLWRELGIEVGRLPQADYYHLLSRATAAVSCTIGGSLTLALYEAQYLGATPIAPHGRNGLPPFTEMYHPTFDLLRPYEAIEMVESGVDVTIDKQWFSQDYFIKTLKPLIS